MAKWKVQGEYRYKPFPLSAWYRDECNVEVEGPSADNAKALVEWTLKNQCEDFAWIGGVIVSGFPDNHPSKQKKPTFAEVKSEIWMRKARKL